MSASLALADGPIWDDAPGLGLAPLGGDASCDVCVVGLGGSGLAAVEALLGAGRRVVAIDAGTVGGGAAGRNGGFLIAGLYAFHHAAVALYGRERARRLYQLTIAELQRLAAQVPEAVRLAGSLRLATSRDEEDDCRAQLDAMRADELPIESYDGPEGRGLLVPTDGAMQPLRRVRTLARHAIARGATLHEHTRAVDIAGDAVRTPRGTIACREGVVVAVDGALDVVLPELASHVRTARLQMLGTAPTSAVRVPRPVYARWGYDYWQQLDDGAIALGGARDVGGDDEWTHDTQPTETVQRALDVVLRARLGVVAPIVRRWAASVGYTESGLPILAEVRAGVWACGGYSGTGNVLGALCGRAAALHAVRAPDREAAELIELLTG